MSAENGKIKEDIQDGDESKYNRSAKDKVKKSGKDKVGGQTMRELTRDECDLMLAKVLDRGRRFVLFLFILGFGLHRLHRHPFIFVEQGFVGRHQVRDRGYFAAGLYLVSFLCSLFLSRQTTAD